MGKGKFKQTEIGNIPEEWTIKEVGELGEIQTGKGTKKLEIGKFPIIGSNGLLGYTDEFLEDEDLIFTGRVGTIGKINYQKKQKAWISDNVLYFKTKKIEVLRYIYYFLMNTDFSYLNVGSTQPLIKQSDFKKIKIGIPKNQEELLSIAKILLDLDAKIELNQQMNKTLEAIGQAIFKRCFVDFEFQNEKGKPYKSSDGEMVDSELGEIPKGWRVGVFSDLVDNIKEPLKPGTHLRDRKYVPINCLSMRNIGIEAYKDFSEAKSSLIAFEKGDILFGAMRAYFHRVNLAPFPGITRTTTFVLRPKKKQYLSYALFLLNQDASVEYANAHSKGSTMPYAAWEGSLSEMPILLPDERIIEKFYIVLSSTLEKISNLIFENENLKEIRDSLLPKLMSGKIRVKIPEGAKA